MINVYAIGIVLEKRLYASNNLDAGGVYEACIRIANTITNAINSGELVRNEQTMYFTNPCFVANNVTGLKIKPIKDGKGYMVHLCGSLQNLKMAKSNIIMV